MSAEGNGSRRAGDGRRITLYGPAEIPFTEKVRRALHYKGLDFELVEPSDPSDYRRWNPKSGLLPVLEIDGEIHPDSTAILFKLDELFPDPPLLSPDARISGQQKQLEDWADENLLWYFNKWLRSQANAETDAGAGAGAGAGGGVVRRYAVLRRFLAWLRAGGTWERPETAILRGIGDRLDDLMGFLGTRPFFYSNRVSMADLGVYAMLYSMSLETIPGSKTLVSNRPPLVEFMQRVEAATGDRPASA
jgi:glutathione S-transferase